jgi:hypothetical protein
MYCPPNLKSIQMCAPTDGWTNQLQYARGHKNSYVENFKNQIYGNVSNMYFYLLTFILFE